MSVQFGSVVRRPVRAVTELHLSTNFRVGFHGSTEDGLPYHPPGFTAVYSARMPTRRSENVWNYKLHYAAADELVRLHHVAQKLRLRSSDQSP